jgi:hypothetical protein
VTRPNNYFMVSWEAAEAMDRYHGACIVHAKSCGLHVIPWAHDYCEFRGTQKQIDEFHATAPKLEDFLKGPSGASVDQQRVRSRDATEGQEQTATPSPGLAPGLALDWTNTPGDHGASAPLRDDFTLCVHVKLSYVSLIHSATETRVVGWHVLGTPTLDELKLAAEERGRAWFAEHTNALEVKPGLRKE